MNKSLYRSCFGLDVKHQLTEFSLFAYNILWDMVN